MSLASVYLPVFRIKGSALAITAARLAIRAPHSRPHTLVQNKSYIMIGCYRSCGTGCICPIAHNVPTNSVQRWQLSKRWRRNSTPRHCQPPGDHASRSATAITVRQAAHHIIDSERGSYITNAEYYRSARDRHDAVRRNQGVDRLCRH
jgi:hypothetical protein